ncbi:MAG TPA: translocation/assembly module TamB domain-containing protein [Polyangiaceae bacterium]|nr:translocation/assembly module TamB domain-containing protein [Polyangiaceae bacterium]
MVERRAPTPSVDPMRLVARVLCVVFGAIGALPLLAELLLSLGAVQNWAAHATADAVRQHLGVESSFRVRLHVLPLRLVVSDLVVDANDGGSPALQVERLRLTPGIFGLLAGRLDIGDLEVQAPRARLVVRDGKLSNVAYRLPARRAQSGSEAQATRSPFGSLSISGGRLDLDLDGARLSTGAVDLDVFAEQGPSFEVMLSTSVSSLDSTRAVAATDPATAPVFAHDDDVLCRLDLRARIEGPTLLLRRLSAIGVADLDAAPATRPSCDIGEEAVGRFALRLSQLRLNLREPLRPQLRGNVLVRAPLGLLNRAMGGPPLLGWAAFSGDARYDGSSRLPELHGRVSGSGIGIADYNIARDLGMDLHVSGDAIVLPRTELTFSDGRIVAEGGRIEPFAAGAPMSLARMEGKGVLFESMMRDLGVTPDTIVRWNLLSTVVTNLRGTLSPLSLDAELSAETRDFEIFDRAFHESDRRHMIGVKSASLRGKVGVRPHALLLHDMHTHFGKSSMFVKLVSIGFDNQLVVTIPPGAKLHLPDISPLIDIRMAGLAELDIHLAGISSDPLLTGNIKVTGFEFGGFPLGDIHGAKVKFRPLWLELTELRAQKGQSDFNVPYAKLDFGTRASLLIEAHTKSDALDFRDFFAMWHFDEDPRFDAVAGRSAVDARIRYVLGGPEDHCRGGVLQIAGELNAHDLMLFDEHFDGGRSKFGLVWDDRDAAYRGMLLEVPELSLQKGSGSMSGSLRLTRGAKLDGQLMATAVPLGKIDGLPTLVRAVEGSVNATATLSGTLDALRAEVSGSVSPIRIGRASLPSSTLQVRLEPPAQRAPPVGVTRCGQPISAPFDRSTFERDPPDGQFHIDGVLFGGQLSLFDLRVTRQRNKTLRGRIEMAGLDLGALLELRPEVALAQERSRGLVSGRVDVDELSLADPAAARGRIALSQLRLGYNDFGVELVPGMRPVVIANRKLVMPSAGLSVVTPRGQRATLDLSGSLADLGRNPLLDARLVLRPTALSGLVGVLPRIERANGTLTGRLHLVGPLGRPRYTGGLELDRGELLLRGLPLPLSDVQLAVAIDGSELNVTRGSARMGSGSVTLSGGAPVRGFSLGEARLRLTARDISLPMKDGVRAVADAELLARYRPTNDDDSERHLPRITGSVLLRALEYRRPVAMAADLNALAQRGKRTEFLAYDSSEDAVAFDLNIKAQRPLKIHNDLIEAELLLDPEGLTLAGTNARFGLRGNLRVRPGGRLVLRQSEFEISEGSVRFDDLTRIAPRVDVTATTDYRRYSDAPGSNVAQAPGTYSGASSAATGGRWNIRLHAYGDADNLRVDLTSDPALAQDDIFLLLTVGLTRAELDQAQSASVGESVALEALGTLTGADRAVKNVVPLIDEFRFGSAYSSRTGRTEPTVTVGKRLTDRVRANVTSGLGESREIRSNVEWRLSPRVSVEGSYDNVNDISSSSLGNLGADVRWRLEFE